MLVCTTLTERKAIVLVLWVVYFPYSLYLQVSFDGNYTFHGPQELSNTLPGENILPKFQIFETKQVFNKLKYHTADLHLGFSKL